MVIMGHPICCTEYTGILVMVCDGYHKSSLTIGCPPIRCQNPQHWPWHMWKCLCVPNLYVAPGAAVMSCAGLSDWGWTRGLFWKFWRWLRCLPSWPERRIDMCGKDSRWRCDKPSKLSSSVGWACFWHVQFLRPPLQRCKNAAQKRDCPKHSCKGCGEERLQRQLKGSMTPKQVNHPRWHQDLFHIATGISLMP